MRKPTLLALLLGLSGCVVPIGPEWSDPEGNSPPTLEWANPPVGSILGHDPDAGAPLVVEVALEDRNTRDPLFARWLIDYPPFDETISRLAHETTQPGGSAILRPVLSFAPSCTDDRIAPGFSSHRLLLVASDGPFLSADPEQAPWDAVVEGHALVRAAWQFELACP